MKGSIMYWVKQHLIQPEPIPLSGPFTAITIPPESKELFKKHFPCSFLEQAALPVYSLQHFNSLHFNFSFQENLCLPVSRPL